MLDQTHGLFVQQTGAVVLVINHFHQVFPSVQFASDKALILPVQPEPFIALSDFYVSLPVPVQCRPIPGGSHNVPQKQTTLRRFLCRKADVIYRINVAYITKGASFGQRLLVSPALVPQFMRYAKAALIIGNCQRGGIIEVRGHPGGLGPVIFRPVPVGSNPVMTEYRDVRTHYWCVHDYYDVKLNTSTYIFACRNTTTHFAGKCHTRSR